MAQPLGGGPSGMASGSSTLVGDVDPALASSARNHPKRRANSSDDPETGWDDAAIHDSDEDASEHERLLDPLGPDTMAPTDADEAIELKPLGPDGERTGAEEDSAYAEVRAAVRNYDQDLPCNTIRAWVIGLSLVVVGASMNTLFSLRHPSISIGALIAQVVAYPLGHAWARVMPKRRFETFGYRWSLNPGPFNVKEHGVIVVMASVSFSVAYATDIILAQLVFYKQDFGIPFQLMLTISTQSLGYGIAGIMRKVLVYPASMIWPGTLVSVSLMNAMYARDDKPDPTVFGGNIPRYRWFGLVTLASFLYYFIPGFLAKFLSVFAFPTWIAPDNVVVNQLFGGVTGLSILPITFDWTQVAGFVGSPLIPPWHAIANTLIGVVLFFVIGVSILHYGGVWYSAYLPMSDASTYDNTGAPYNTTRILSQSFTLDEQAYSAYSPLFISTTFAMSYGLSFAAISSLVVYTWLNSRHYIMRQWRASTQDKPDVHMKMMGRYPEAPSSWYMGLFAIMLFLGFYTVLGYQTNMTWWAFLLAVFISFSFSLPIGIIQAITNNQIGLNVLTEFIYGYIQPGRPLALMIFKTFGYITMSQALNFVADLKFGHYMKIPPRTMFMAQVVATTVSCFVQIIVLNIALSKIDGVCTLDQPERFTCPGGRVFFAASVIWGLIGPARMFSPGQVYSSLFYFFLIGALTPLLIHLLSKRYPNSPLKHLMAPLIFGGAGALPPATPLNYLSWGAVGFLFQKVIRDRRPAWWARLNFLTSSGLDLGLAFGTLFIFFAFTLSGVGAPRWWGNEVSGGTLDFKGGAVQVKVGEGQTFGPESW